MNDEEKWAAVLTNDAQSDGRFFYAVGSTGIFCRPSCPSRRPVRENVRFFDTAQEAEAAGYRPCKRCRPDLVEFSPSRWAAEEARRIMDRDFADRAALRRDLKKLGLSARRLSTLFAESYGLSPSRYLSGLRLLEAKRRLSQTDEPILEVASATGFGGTASFYRFFRQGVGLSPGAYRRQARMERQQGGKKSVDERV